jgi:hypothetical protein
LSILSLASRTEEGIGRLARACAFGYVEKVLPGIGDTDKKMIAVATCDNNKE